MLFLKGLLLVYLFSTVAGSQRLCDEHEKFCTVGFCATPGCNHCTRQRAVCQTSDSAEPVPQTLPADIRRLLIYYSGPPVNLNSSMFDKYHQLNNITLYGNFMSISPHTFSKHKGMKYFTLKHTLVPSLPDYLFHPDQFLKHLLLPHNRFKSIPENVFHQLGEVRKLDFSYNPINICNITSIGDSFATLASLEWISLAGLGNSDQQNCSLPHRFLGPLADVTFLDLSESFIVQRNENMLRILDHVKQIRINNMVIYKSCPAKANNLLRNLPPNITNLELQGWRTNQQISKDCYLNETSFMPLRGLKLGMLSFRYSDKILGDELTASLFKGLSIANLDLTWCRLTSVQHGALDAHSGLRDLLLEGNQLGPRNFKLYKTAKAGYRLNAVVLRSIGVFSDSKLQYDLGNFMEDSPNIKSLTMNNNFLVRLPKFSQVSSETQLANHRRYETLILGFDDNRLTDLSNKSTYEMCTLMPKLRKFSAQNNLLEDITGLCRSIWKLTLADNYIGQKEAENLEAVKSLTNLERLELPRNGISFLPPDLTSQMVRLQNFIMAGNSIKVVNSEFFAHNPELTAIDFSSNLLTSIDVDLFMFSEKLYMIYLQGNLINYIPQNITNRLDYLSNKSLYMFDIVGNPLECSCDTKDFQHWVLSSTIVANVKNLSCGRYVEHRIGDHVYDYKISEFYCKWLTSVIVVAAALIAVIFSSPLGICLYRNRWYVSHIRVVAKAMVSSAQRIKMDQLFKHDAFISYNPKSNSDSIWIIQNFIPEVEGDAESGSSSLETALQERIKCYIHDRDSKIGTEKYTELCQAVEDSRKLIIILSNSYLANPACLNEANLLAGYGSDGAKCYQPDRILVLVLEEPDEGIIRPPITGLMKSCTVIDVTENIRMSSRKMKSVWNQIQKFVAKPNIIYKKAPKKSKRACANNAESDCERTLLYQRNSGVSYS